ncbi:hypothetical protein BDA96_05G115700 [Sorghum bicolor]|uniref:Uncharacterized protein n=2 Tax=Sorghum bicolor TaxID=4558 RepID=A0A921QYW8_SORBI|nr:hypothetical protein BDA96_05G115700 [Sorghum bicolor]KXG28329.1 hypothetical protein SORBI_3005G110300 [Sorghum bicolor]
MNFVNVCHITVKTCLFYSSGCPSAAWLFLVFLMATMHVGLVCIRLFCYSCCFSIGVCLASCGCHARDLCHDMSAMALLTTGK